MAHRILVMCENCSSTWLVEEVPEHHFCPSCGWVTECWTFEDEFPELEFPEQ